MESNDYMARVERLDRFMTQWQDGTWKVVKGMAELHEIVATVRASWQEARQDIHDLASQVENLEARIAAGESAQGELLQIAQEMRDAVPDEPPMPAVEETPAEPVPANEPMPVAGPVDDAGSPAEPVDTAAETPATVTEEPVVGEVSGGEESAPDAGTQTPDEAAAGGEPEHPEGSILNS